MIRRLLLLLLLTPFLLFAETVVFLGSASDSELFSAAFRRLHLPEKIRFEYYCFSVDDKAKISDALRRADLVILNARGREARQAAETQIDFSRTKLYALSSRLLRKGIPARSNTYRTLV